MSKAISEISPEKINDMDIKVICADCGRHIGTFVRLGGRKDTEIEIHACYHKELYDHIKELKTQTKKLETENKSLEAPKFKFEPS